jgi:hypothetical protein
MGKQASFNERYGIITISDQYYYHKKDFLFDVYQKMKFLPLDIISRPCERYIEIKGVSPYFEKVNPGQIIPEYRIIIVSTEDDPVHEVHVIKDEPDNAHRSVFDLFEKSE